MMSGYERLMSRVRIKDVHMAGVVSDTACSLCDIYFQVSVKIPTQNVRVLENSTVRFMFNTP